MTSRLLRSRYAPVGAVLTSTVLAVGVAVAPAAVALAAEIVSPAETVQLEVRKGLLLKLDRPVSTVFVADPDVADVQAQSADLLYLFGKKAGSTTIFAVDENREIVLRRQIDVRHNLTRLRQVLSDVLSGGSFELQSIDGGIIVTGEAPNAGAAQDVREIAARFLGQNETLINRMAVTSPTQVSLRVKVAEVSREATRLFGINWEVLASPGDFLFGLATGRPFTTPVPPGFTRSPDPNLPAGAAFGRFSSGSVDISALIDALERDRLVTVLAEPNLTALSGETASFLAGGEFPVPVGTDDNQIQIEFKQFGVSLAFTPTVLSPDRISLRVRPEVSDLSQNGSITLNGLNIPALATRRAETTVELGSGQSFAIGGLISKTTRNNIDKFPVLGDVPVLGQLFRSTTFQRSESELVILVTPHLVRAVAPSALRTPLDGPPAPTDLARVLAVRTPDRGAAPGTTSPRLVIRGQGGFTLE